MSAERELLEITRTESFTVDVAAGWDPASLREDVRRLPVIDSKATITIKGSPDEGITDDVVVVLDANGEMFDAIAPEEIDRWREMLAEGVDE